MYFDLLMKRTGKKVGEIFPNLQLIVHGGVNYEPYRVKMEESLGRKIDTIETYPASEGFVAFQDSQYEEGLLLILNKGIFYEFVPVSRMHEPNPPRVQLSEVQIGINYAIVMNTNAGLWGYLIGDTVKFTSTNPYRLVVTGRTKHYISAFGEHVIAEEVEESLIEAANALNVKVDEFTVAPRVNPPASELPYHEWFIEFDNEFDEGKIEEFRLRIDRNLRKKNIYYNDLIEGKILQPLKITRIRQNGFKDYMRGEGKLGGQNKVKRLSNDREIAVKMNEFVQK
jgi:hypothetical protein